MDFYNEMTQQELERFYRGLRNRSKRRDSFSVVNGMRICAVTREEVRSELTVTDRSQNPWGYVHGGCLATLADSTAGNLVFANGYQCLTLSSSMNYLRPAKGAFIRCTARPQKVGRATSVVNTVLTDPEGNEVATGVFTFFHVSALSQAELEELMAEE